MNTRVQEEQRRYFDYLHLRYTAIEKQNPVVFRGYWVFLLYGWHLQGRQGVAKVVRVVASKSKFIGGIHYQIIAFT